MNMLLLHRSAASDAMLQDCMLQARTSSQNFKLFQTAGQKQWRVDVSLLNSD